MVELATRLTDADLAVEFVAPGPEPIVDRSGLTVVPDDTVAGVLARGDGAVRAVVAAGGDPAVVVGRDDVHRLLASVAEGGGVLAGICAGVLILADAGLTAGRRITHNYRAPWAPPEIRDFVAHLWDGADI